MSTEKRLEPRAPGPIKPLAGKYMTFKLEGEEYGIDILKIRELIASMPITRVPNAPAFVRGVINLRGKVIPVIDVRLKFGLPPAEATGQTVIVVVQLASARGTIVLGMLVDEVLEVLGIDANEIEDVPSFGSEVPADFLLGLGKVERRVIFLLDIDRVLAPLERSVAA